MIEFFGGIMKVIHGEKEIIILQENGRSDCLTKTQVSAKPKGDV